jgi:hypothetical protein
MSEGIFYLFTHIVLLRDKSWTIKIKSIRMCDTFTRDGNKKATTEWR